MKKNLFFIILVLMTFVLSSCDMEIIPSHQVDIIPGFDDNLNTQESFDRLFDDSTKKELVINITQSEWNRLDQSMIDYAKTYQGDLRNDIYVKADLIYTDGHGVVKVDYVGLRTRGNLSRTRIQDNQGRLNMSHFKISFREIFGTVIGEHEALIKNRTVFELEEIDLKYNRNQDTTYLNEKFSMDLFNQFDVFAQKTTLINLYVNIDDQETFYGLYTAFEPIDKKFIEKRLDASQTHGDLYKVLWQQYGPAALTNDYPSLAIGIRDIENNYRPSYDLKTNKKISDHSALKSLIVEINRLEGQAFVTFIESHFEIEMFLRLLAIGVLLGNPDDYRAMCNNYYLYHNPQTDKWMMIPYDYDHGLGQGWDGAPIFSNYSVGMDIYTWGNLNAHMLDIEDYPHPLVDKVLSVSQYRILYEGYLLFLTDEENQLFCFDAFETMYLQQKTLYDDGLSEAMLNLRFDLRDIENYINDKRLDVIGQID
ncbi:MAG: CotH kinase family protein [Acholeplasmataceae bacterium]|nr:CotH kinase family protein [Acholeplasmataceae bacterium]